MLDKSTLGKAGETLAVNYLKKSGYNILDRNVRTLYSEVDIIAIDKDTLVFVEVKTRSNTKYGYPIEAIGKKKILRLKNAIKHYSEKHKELPKLLRIDTVSIIVSKGSAPEIQVTKVD